MLQYRTVHPKTLELLKNLMQIKEFDDFFLVGGTALALQLGHRVSVDLDLFTLNEFNTQNLIKILNYHFILHEIVEDKNSLNINIELFDRLVVKVDFIKYSYPLINPIQIIDEIRILSIEDIIPMKLSAVSGRGLKKDFFDVYYLLNDYSFNQMLELFQKKFPNVNHFHVLKSLIFFDDAENDPDPETYDNTNWSTVKKKIITEIKKIKI